MSEHRFTCPHCNTAYPLHTYSIGMSELIELRCTACPAVLGVHVISASTSYSWPHKLLLTMPFVFLIPLLQFFNLVPSQYSEGFWRRLSRRLGSCECGGTFSHDAPHRCPNCLHVLPMHEIRRQVPAAMSGVYTTSFREV